MFTKFFALITIALWGVTAKAEENLVALLYHHVSNSTPPSTSITPEQFRQHMQWISEHHTVMSLHAAMHKLSQNQPLPNKAVVITFDDGYANIFKNAHKILQEFKFSYSIFINPDSIGKRKDQMTWQQIKTLKTQGVEFYNHTNGHIHMLDKQSGEDEKGRIARITQNIEASQKILDEQLGKTTKMLAYPYGEFNQKTAEILEKLGFIGFGQHSGAINSQSNFLALPRFPAAGVYANLNTLKVKLNSLAMPVLFQSAVSTQLPINNKGIEVTLKVSTEDLRVSQVSCFYQGKNLQLEKKQEQVVIRQLKPFESGRSRINCTAPSMTQTGRYYWYSMPFFVKNKMGKSPD